MRSAGPPAVQRFMTVRYMTGSSAGPYGTYLNHEGCGGWRRRVMNNERVWWWERCRVRSHCEDECQPHTEPSPHSYLFTSLLFITHLLGQRFYYTTEVVRVYFFPTVVAFFSISIYTSCKSWCVTCQKLSTGLLWLQQSFFHLKHRAGESWGNLPTQKDTAVRGYVATED